MDRVFEYKVTSEYDGENIKTVLKQHFKMSTALINELKKYDDGICVNGKHMRVVDTVSENDLLRVTLREGASETIIPKNIPLDIVYEDEDILVINKPAHMPTHPSMGNYENTVANGIMYYFKSRGEERVFRAVNRLDKDTSGLMAIAKNAYIHARLGEEIADGTLKRRYTAIVCGNLETDGTIDAPIDRAHDSTIERIVRPDGQRAVTHYSVIKRFGDYTLINLELETGRTHQIRVHMAHIGHPLAGDWLYGTEDKETVPRQMLHSCYLRFIHPVTGEKMEFKSETAQDMSQFIQKILEKNNKL